MLNVRFAHLLCRRGASFRNPPNLRKYSISDYKPLEDKDRVFTNLYGRYDWHLKDAVCRGDYFKIDMILKRGPKWILNELKTSRIRGRGGASFLLFKKLEFMMKNKKAGPRYLVVNGAEGEPGTCKDRELMRHEPHKIIEGALILSRLLKVHVCFMFIRAEFYNEACIMQMAVAEAYESGILGSKACGTNFSFDMFIQRGAGHYVCGEETALINCLMGEIGRPHKKPPYPSEKGLFEKPTLVVNTETVAYVPTICRRGGEWYACLGGGPDETGTKLFSISGHVNTPCLVEEQLAVPLRYLIECHGGGVIGGWDNLLAVIPGGASSPIVPAKYCDDLILDFESLQSVHSNMGTGGIIVIKKGTDVLQAMVPILHFFKIESCHQCTQCRNASQWFDQYLHRFIKGDAQPEDIDWIWKIAEYSAGQTYCGFSYSNAWAIEGIIRNFRPEIEERMKQFAACAKS